MYYFFEFCLFLGIINSNSSLIFSVKLIPKRNLTIQLHVYIYFEIIKINANTAIIDKFT